MLNVESFRVSGREPFIYALGRSSLQAARVFIYAAGVLHCEPTGLALHACTASASFKPAIAADRKRCIVFKSLMKRLLHKHEGRLTPHEELDCIEHEEHAPWGV